ncbi:MAG: GNAT family protein [Candidatus Gracilibacteria bacterium]|jgi:RimJ/RimL family protein N-acetyltransferase
MKFTSKQFVLKNGEKLSIREGKKSDASDLIKYLNQVAGESDFLTFTEGEFKMTKKGEEAFVEEAHKADNEIFLVAEIGKEIVGVLNVNANSKKRMKHIGTFGVSLKKAHWGKGIGALFIQTMLDWAKSNGVTRKMNLSVMANNKRAMKLYKKFGFKKEGLLKRDALINGKFYDAYLMGLLID